MNRLISPDTAAAVRLSVTWNIGRFYHTCARFFVQRSSCSSVIHTGRYKQADESARG